MSVDENILASSPEDALVGTLFADCYEILSVLGQGGMSVVYKARYVPLDQLVAVKVMHAHMTASQATFQRLKQEAKAAGSLDHPNIGRILRMHISDDGFPFLVADLIDGQTVQSAVLKDGPFDEHRFRHVFSQILSALEHAHARGIVHRDIKPSNIMLTTQDGETDHVKIVDFGISKMLSDSAAVTQGITQSASSNIFGSPLYMSPEQCTGRRTDVRTDIYSLACVMYEALTGVTAFIGETALETMYHQVHDLPAPFSTVAPERKISPVLESAIFAALRKEPSDRPQTAAEFRSTLFGRAPVRKVSRLRQMHRKASKQLMAVAGAATVGALILLAIYHLQALEKPDTAGKTQIAFPLTAEGCYHAGETEIRNPTTVPGRIHNTLERRARALEFFNKANELLDSQTGKKPDPLIAFQIKHQLALTLEAEGKYAEALRFFHEARKRSMSLSPQQQRLSYIGLSQNATSRGQPHESLNFALKAAQLSEATIRREEKTFPPSRRLHQNAAESWQHVAECYQKLVPPDLANAENACRKAYNHSLQSGHDERVRLSAPRRLADVLLMLNKDAEAKQLIDQYKMLLADADQNAPGLIEECCKWHQLLGTFAARSNPLAARYDFAESVRLAKLIPSEFPDEKAREVSDIMFASGINYYRCNEITAGDQAIALARRTVTSKYLTYSDDKWQPKVLYEKALAVKRLSTALPGQQTGRATK